MSGRCARRRWSGEEAVALAPGVTWEEQQAPPRRRSSFAQQKAVIELKLRGSLQRSWWSGVSRPARRDIEEALDLLKQLENEDVPDGQESSCSSGMPQGLARANGKHHSDPLTSLLDGAGEDDDRPASIAKTMTESRRWLVQTFTSADLDAAEGHDAGLEPASPSSIPEEEEEPQASAGTGSGSAGEREGAVEVDVRLQEMLKAPDVVPLLSRVGEFDFDTLAFYNLTTINRQPLRCLGAHLLRSNHLVQTLASQGKVEASPGEFEACLLRFLGRIDELYDPEVLYHNSAHAADVVATMEWFLRSDYMRARISTLDHLMAIVAGAVHDVGHPGRNNLFLSKTMAPLAVTYNDKSILENMHCAKSFEAMQADAALNWFSLLPRRHESEEPGHAHDLQQYVRRGLIDMVLGTDMTKHAEHVRKIETFVEEQRKEALAESTVRGKQEALEKKLLLLDSMLHAADISNPCKPHKIMMRWTEMISLEFWAQGDEERSLGVDISPLCDRESGKKTVPKGQIGFINFVIRPFYQPIAELIPEVKEAVEELAKNRSFWEEKDNEQARFETLFPEASLGGVLATS